jgi:hypothetical protein
MQSRWFIVASLGIMIGATGCASMNGHEREEEGDEVKMKFEQVPPAVQQTLSREAGGARIETVDKESSKGKTIYESDVMMNGKNWEIRVAEDGTLISKKVDHESGEHKGHE